MQKKSKQRRRVDPRTAAGANRKLPQLEPLTVKQEQIWEEWTDHPDANVVATGCAGTGKTFLCLYLALKTALDKNTPQDQIVIIRSVVATRPIGHLPGSAEEKVAEFNVPYKAIVNDLYGDSTAFDHLQESGIIKFESTSFIRGLDLKRTIILVDESQNLNFHELESVLTRCGTDTRIMFCGDYAQSDFKDGKEKEGIKKFLSILEHMPSRFSIVEFTWEDIVRSELVRDYMMTKEYLHKENEII